MSKRLELTDAQIDESLARFDQTEPVLQRRIIAKFVSDRELFRMALESIAELQGDAERQEFKLTRFQCSQLARKALNLAGVRP